MTKRQKEIVIALRDGARLRPPVQYSSLWLLEYKTPRLNSTWVYDDTIQKMKKLGLLEYTTVGYRTLVPTETARMWLQK